MKRATIALFASLSLLASNAQEMINSIEYSQLYIVGSATSAGWNEMEAPEMTRINDGVFEWTGELKAGEEFKFINTRSWYKNILSPFPDITVELNQNYCLDFYASWDLTGKDWKFKVPQTDVYTVVVDLHNMKMVVKEPSENLHGGITRLYVTGSAVNNKVIELNRMYGVELKKTITCVPGNIILTNSSSINEHTIYFGPRFEDVDITFGAGYNSEICIVDNDSRGWSIPAAGDYSLYIHKPENSFMGMHYAPRDVLYLAGGCCELNWNYWDEGNKYFYPNPENPDELIWEGMLRIRDQNEGNCFKILTALDWGGKTYHPYEANTPAEGITDARITGGDDVKWTIEKDGYYRMTFNTRTEQLETVYLGLTNQQLPDNEPNISSIAAATSKDARISVIGHTVYVDANEAVSVTLCNLTGTLVARACNHRSGTVSGPLAPGLYLITIDGKTTKLLVD